mgnify:FL=1
MKKLLSLTLSIALCTAITSQPVMAAAPLDARLQLAANQANLSPRDAAAIAQRQLNGRVLGVNRSDAGGRPTYRVKILSPQGDVRTITIDATSGAVISTR